MRAAFGRVETIAVGGTPVSILLIKNPAGANEVLRTLRLEAGERRRLDLWIALNDRIADGRDVSWVWDADFELLAGRVAARRLRRHARAGDGAAAEVRRAGRRSAIAVEAGDRALARPRRRRRRRAASSPCPPTRRCSSCASCSSERGLAQGVLAMSADPATEAIWHDVECGGYAADLPLWARARPRAPPARCSTSAPATGRVALHLAAAGHRGRRASTLDAGAARRRSRDAPRLRGLAVETVRADARRLRPRARVRADRSRRCSSSSCSAARRSAARCCAASPRTSRPAARSRRRCSPRTARGVEAARRRAAARRPRDRRLGLLEPAARGRRIAAGGDRDPPAAPDRLARRRADRGAPTRSGSTRSTLDRARGRGGRGRACAPRGRIAIPPDRRPRRLGRRASWRRP